MKRPLLLVLVVMMLAWFAVRHERVRSLPHFSPPTEQFRAADRASRDARRAREQLRAKAHQATLEARNEAQRAIAEARSDFSESLDEATHELQGALQEAAEDIREAVDGIPVPIVPGTRVDIALPQPPALPEHPLAAVPHVQPVLPPTPPLSPNTPGFRGLVERPQPLLPRPAAPAPPQQLSSAPVGPKATHLLTGLISITEERAKDEARKLLDKEVTDWLELAGVPRSWKPPVRLIDAMIIETTVKPVVKDDDTLFKDYSTLYVANLLLDVSPERRATFLESYKRQLVHERMVLLGGALGFVLICLGAISGYIRADEVTRGYYTNRLRLLAAGGVGAAGVLIYQMLT
jgi:hypothetical protein